MIDRVCSGLFVAEGSSDMPLAGIVTSMFLENGVQLRLAEPDFSRLSEKVRKDVSSRVEAGVRLAGGEVDVIVVHRDADNAGYGARVAEIGQAVAAVGAGFRTVPVVPVRMTEAWLLLDETAIRRVAGNPRGRSTLQLPKLHEVESIADPKGVLRTCLVDAACASGRRRDHVARRFTQHRRQLLDRLDRKGTVTQLTSWRALVEVIRTVADTLRQ